MDNKQIVNWLKHQLIASCQPVDDGPMDTPDVIARMALACRNGGAVAVRIQGVTNVSEVARALDIPIVGIVKRDLPDSDVRITPFLEDVYALAEAGAKIIAYDATQRKRPVATSALVAAIHASGCIAMADCATLEDGILASEMGVELIGTTMSGYTGGPVPKDPDYQLIRDFAERGYKVVAEGRFNQPELAGKAVSEGAYCVTVGSAITRIEHICQWFYDAIGESSSSERTCGKSVKGQS